MISIGASDNSPHKRLPNYHCKSDETQWIYPVPAYRRQSRVLDWDSIKLFASPKLKYLTNFKSIHLDCPPCWKYTWWHVEKWCDSQKHVYIWMKVTSFLTREILHVAVTWYWRQWSVQTTCNSTRGMISWIIGNLPFVDRFNKQCAELTTIGGPIKWIDMPLLT